MARKPEKPILIDTEGRRPYLPLDHRHTGFRPKRHDLDGLTGNVRLKNNEHATRVKDHILRLEIRFGIALHNVKALAPQIRAILSCACMADIMETLIAGLKSESSGVIPQMLERCAHLRSEAITSSNAMIDALHEAVENDAFKSHTDWMVEIVRTKGVRGARQAVARSKLSMEDVFFDSRERMEEMISCIENVLDIE